MVEEDRLPLSALSLVAGDGVGEFHLEGVQIGVFPHLLHAFPLVADIHIVLLDGLEESVLLVVAEGRGFALERVQYDFSFNFNVLVWEIELSVGESESVEFPFVAQSLHLGDVSVGDEIEFFNLFRPEVVVFHHHEEVACR